jgi:hypothetical protein
MINDCSIWVYKHFTMLFSRLTRNAMLQGKSGSFLGRRSISLSRVVALTGTEGEAGCMVNTSNRNFVFTSLSPDTAKDQAQPLDDSITEEASPQQEPIRKVSVAAAEVLLK